MNELVSIPKYIHSQLPCEQQTILQYHQHLSTPLIWKATEKIRDTELYPNTDLQEASLID